MIRLEKVNGENVWDLLKLRVSEEQKNFVADNDISIIEAYTAITGNGYAFPFGIYDGDTPVERIFEKDGIISTDVFSTYSDWTQIGESAMIVINSETGEYEKIDVPGKMGYRVYTAPADDIT